MPSGRNHIPPSLLGPTVHSWVFPRSENSQVNCSDIHSNIGPASTDAARKTWGYRRGGPLKRPRAPPAVEKRTPKRSCVRATFLEEKWRPRSMVQLVLSHTPSPGFLSPTGEGGGRRAHAARRATTPSVHVMSSGAQSHCSEPRTAGTEGLERRGTRGLDRMEPMAPRNARSVPGRTAAHSPRSSRRRLLTSSAARGLAPHLGDEKRRGRSERRRGLAILQAPRVLLARARVLRYFGREGREVESTSRSSLFVLSPRTLR